MVNLGPTINNELCLEAYSMICDHICFQVMDVVWARLDATELLAWSGFLRPVIRVLNEKTVKEEY
jgi:hypothetical protein